MSTNITCAVCSTTFEFTQEEQEFYNAKGFQAPRKCKACRDAAKAGRGGGGGRGGFGGGGGGFGRPPRQMYDVVCDGCGTHTQVPFEPRGGKPVYCRDCFQPRQSY